jgi:hypothetical protein
MSKLSPADASTFVGNLKTKLQHLRFYPFNKVITFDDTSKKGIHLVSSDVYATYHNPLSNEITSFNRLQFDKASFTKVELEQNIQFHSKNYLVIAGPKSLEAGNLLKKEDGMVKCHHSARVDLDVEGGTFRFKKPSPNSFGDILPRKIKTTDIICLTLKVQKDKKGKFIRDKKGQVVLAKDKRGYLLASNWFICSHQFLHFWRAIMFEDHPSFKHSDEEKRKKWLMSGCRLMCNGYLKWQEILQTVESSKIGDHISHLKPRARIPVHGNSLVERSSDKHPEMENLLSTCPTCCDEIKKRYWVMRTECESQNYVHIYAALVLIGKYGEIPSHDFIPNNCENIADSDYWEELTGVRKKYDMKRWSLPDGFIEKILTTYIPHFDPKNYDRTWDEINSCITFKVEKWTSDAIVEQVDNTEPINWADLVEDEELYGFDDIANMYI